MTMEKQFAITGIVSALSLFGLQAAGILERDVSQRAADIVGYPSLVLGVVGMVLIFRFIVRVSKELDY